jgi:hypothetical protein
VKGTVIGYDDWWVLPCGAGNGDLESLSVGEGRAHLEMSIKYGVQFKCVGGACSLWNEQSSSNGSSSSTINSSCDDYMKRYSWGVMLEVVHINSGQSATSMHGFEMTRSEETYFTTNNLLCQSIRNDGAVYTLRSNSESDLLAYEALVASRSGLELVIEHPFKGYVPIYRQQQQGGRGGGGLVVPVSLKMDVSEDGVDSIRIRRLVHVPSPSPPHTHTQCIIFFSCSYYAHNIYTCYLEIPQTFDFVTLLSSPQNKDYV